MVMRKNRRNRDSPDYFVNGAMNGRLRETFSRGIKIYGGVMG